MSLMDEFRKQLHHELIGKSIDCCSRWAEKRRIMGNPFPGPYSFKYFPWVRELHDSKATWNVTLKSAQAGATEVGINLALYTIDVLRQNALYVLPTLKDASDFATSRFNVALRNSPYLKGVFTDSNNVGLKMAGNTSLYIRGSKGDSGLKSIPVSVLFLDEMDEMDQSQIELAFQRLRGQPVKKIWMISTPTVPTHGVSPQYALSTQEHFMFKCNGCGRLDELRWPDSLVICGDSINDLDIYRSYFQCTMCKYQYKHVYTENNEKCLQDDKLEALRTGVWTPTMNAVDPDRRGFKINQLFSYTVSPATIVSDYFKSLTNSYARQEFSRSVLGDPFIEEQSQVTEEMVSAAIARGGNYKCKQHNVKQGQNRMITMGVDRGSIGYYTVCEWFYDVRAIDLNESAMCRVLDAGIFTEDDFITYCSRLMYEWKVLGCVIDADPGEAEGKRFAREFPGYVWLSRYREGRTGKSMSIPKVDDYAPLATVDRTSWLDLSLGRFFRERIQLPCDLPTSFSQHLQNEIRMYDKDKYGNPFAVYRNYEKPNHFAHALNYAEIALPLAASVAAGCDVERFL